MRALRLVLLEDHRVEPSPGLVEVVEALAEPDDVVARAQREREPGAVHPVGVTQPLAPSGRR